MSVVVSFGWLLLSKSRSQTVSLLERFRRYPELRRVVVNLKSGTAFRGLAWKHAGEYLILRDVEMVADRNNTARQVVDGETAVRRADIDFIQVVS